MKYTAVANPHSNLTLIEPDGTVIEYARATKEMPVKAEEIKPHPDGIELGTLINMLKTTDTRTLQSFLTTDFSRIGAGTAKKICEEANLYTKSRPSRIAKQEADNLLQVMRKTKFVAPKTDCLSPIGDDLLKKSLKKEFDADFFVTVTRPAAVYRGNPFKIEAGLAYGGAIDKESNAELIRFANKVPLQYQQSACAISKAVTKTNWKQYGLSQSNGNLPVGPIVIVVHMASVWVPFTSESKESIAHYSEIIKEIRLAVQECGRQLGKYVRNQKKEKDAAKKLSYLEKYVPVIGEALQEILGTVDEKKVTENLKDVLERSRK
jgi:DNA topoisomerase-6 subunit B